MPDITLRSAKVLRFADNAGQLKAEATGLDYLFRFGYGFHEEARSVAVRVHVYAVPQRPEAQEGDESEAPPQDESVADVEVECVFALDTLDEFRNEAGEVKMPRRFLAHLTGMAVSTARGVFIGAGRSELLQKAPLPIGAPLMIIDRFVDSGEYPWVDETPAVPPDQQA